MEVFVCTIQINEEELRKNYEFYDSKLVFRYF